MDGPQETPPRPLSHGGRYRRPRQRVDRTTPRRRCMPKDPNAFGTEAVGLLPPEVFTGRESLPAERCLEIYRIMVRARAMEERMIKMSKSGQGHFWIGGPGEEAFNACLGLQVKKGRGPAYDFLHLHYRNSATLVAMGMPLAHGLRQMAMRA